MKRTILTLLAAAATLVPASAQPKPQKSLDIYYIDTEGGNAVLYVTPAGQSVLIDTGFPGARDLDRIKAAIAEAGVKELDYLVSTHYHTDHVGNTVELAKFIPVKTFVDHGATIETREQVPGFQAAYAEIFAKAKHLIAKPGDKLMLAGLDATVVTSDGKVIKKALPGAGKPNPACAGFQERDESRVDIENHQSVGIVFTYGKFKTLNLGDFTYNREKELMCPNNPIGTVDLFLTPHHGSDQSGSPALVHGLQPRVAIMNNGTRKGGAVPSLQTMNSSPGLEDIWQLHYSYAGLLEHNTPGVYIANIDEPSAVANLLNPPPPPAAVPGGPPPGRGAGGRGGGHAGPAFMIKVSANADGSFTVTNTRNNFSKTYAARGK
jgi:beta-lactamase superfamily II metal-dependent hydrolase